MFHNRFITKQDCYKTMVLLYTCRSKQTHYTWIQVTEQLAKCPKQLHFPLYKKIIFKNAFSFNSLKC
jgi:hypothetical protein